MATMPPMPSPAEIAAEQHTQDVFLITIATLVGLGTFIVWLRIIWRTFFVRNLGADDWWMIIAWLLTMGYFAELLILVSIHMGHSIPELTLDDMYVFLKTTLAVEVQYYCIVYSIKVSILLLYLRIAVSKTTRNLCYWTIAVLTVFWMICVIVTLNQCKPFHKAYDPTGKVVGKCINTTAFFYTTSAFNIITDFWILYLPIPTLWAVQRPTREKLALFIVFGIGIFSSTASIVRLHTIYKYTLTTDPFRDGIPVNLWSMVEVNVGMICASLPPLKQVLSCGKRRGGTTTSGAGTRGSRTGNGTGGSRGLGGGRMKWSHGGFAGGSGFRKSVEVSESARSGSQSQQSQSQIGGYGRYGEPLGFALTTTTTAMAVPASAGSSGGSGATGQFGGIQRTQSIAMTSVARGEEEGGEREMYERRFPGHEGGRSTEKIVEPERAYRGVAL